MNISGKCKVFYNQKEGKSWYSTSISKKNENGYDHIPMLVSYKQGIEPGATADINITNGFLTMYKNGKGEKNLLIKVLEYELVQKEEQTNYADGTPRNIQLPF